MCASMFLSDFFLFFFLFCFLVGGWLVGDFDVFRAL